MSKPKEMMMVVLCMLSELGLFYQFYRPIYFLETDIIEKGMVSWTIPRVIILIAMAAMFLFTISFIKGNANGLLALSYAIFLLYFVLVLLIIFSQKKQFHQTLSNEYLDTNLIVYLVTAIVAIVTLILLILRELGGIRVIPNMSSLLLLVILGQFVTHGLAMGEGNIFISKNSLFCGICSVIPYCTIYIFEKRILEPVLTGQRQ